MRGTMAYTQDQQDDAHEWFEETLDAARSVHTTGERRASEGILLALDRWFIARGADGEDTNPLTELTLVVEAVLFDGVLRELHGIRYDRESSVLGNPLGAHLTLTFDDVAQLGEAVFAELAERYSG